MEQAPRNWIDGNDSVEDLIGGRVFAWVGGLAVLLGLAFLFAIGISSGWIGVEARTLLGAGVSAGLLGAGVWLHGHRGRTDAAVAALACGISGLFVTVTVAAQVYDLIPALAGTGLAIAVGAIATTLAVRWESRGIAALGILGALCAPALAGSVADGGSVAILLVALAAAAGVLLWQRWNWLALTAFAIAAPQWVGYLLFGGASLGATVATLVAFGLLGTLMAVGHDVRVKAAGIRTPAAFLLALNAIVVAGAGWLAFAEMGEPVTGKAWLAGLAAAYAAVGLVGPRFAGVSRELGLLSLTLAVVVGDVAFALVADGPALSIGWAATGVAFAAVMRSLHAESGERQLAGLGLGAHLAMAIPTALVIGDPLAVLAGDEPMSAASASAIAAVAAGCLVSGRLAAEHGESWRRLLDATGLAMVALLTALSLDGTGLVGAWAAEAAALALIAQRRDDEIAADGALAFLGLGAMHLVVHEAPPASLLVGLSDPLGAGAVGAALAGVGILAAERLQGFHPQLRRVLYGFAGLVALHVASGLVVTPFETGDGLESTLVSAHQQGQMVLSVFWALVGVAAVAVGLRRDNRPLRLAALGLLGVAVAKVFALDLATLTSVYRAVSFIGLGLLLLLGAFVWQRLRPRQPSDLRETPPALR